MEELNSLFSGFCVNVNLLWYAIGILILADFATGIMKAYKNDGMASSSRLRDGGFKKAGIVLVSLLGYGISIFAGDEKMLISNGILAYYIYTELVSVIENLGELGVPLPPFIAKIRGVGKEDGHDQKL